MTQFHLHLTKRVESYGVAHVVLTPIGHNHELTADEVRKLPIEDWIDWARIDNIEIVDPLGRTYIMNTVNTEEFEEDEGPIYVIDDVEEFELAKGAA